MAVVDVIVELSTRPVGVALDMGGVTLNRALAPKFGHGHSECQVLIINHESYRLMGRSRLHSPKTNHPESNCRSSSLRGSKRLQMSYAWTKLGSTALAVDHSILLFHMYSALVDRDILHFHSFLVEAFP